MIQQAQDTKTEEKPEAAENDTKTDEEANEGAELPEDSLYRLKTKTLEGEDADLSDYAGKVALLVNVASKCGYTPQYEGLEKLYDELKDKD
ncbi:MAG: hypothetical protein KDB29_07795, partial [Planctomycetes bacterium]|nr:hypothetical protein [Planctomycetota bacterium]